MTHLLDSPGGKLDDAAWTECECAGSRHRHRVVSWTAGRAGPDDQPDRVNLKFRSLFCQQSNR